MSTYYHIMYHYSSLINKYYKYIYVYMYINIYILPFKCVRNTSLKIWCLGDYIIF